jgi:hypothetical protein
MKYTQAAVSAPPAPPAAQAQVELMAYKNPGGQHYSKDELLRDA